MEKQLAFEQHEIDMLKALVQREQQQIQDLQKQVNSLSKWLTDFEAAHWRGYFSSIVIAGAAGLLVGAVLNISFELAQPDTTSRWWCALFAFAQLMAVFVLFYIASFLDKNFGSWLVNSYSGYMFSLLLFLAQPRLAVNVETAIKF